VIEGLPGFGRIFTRGIGTNLRDLLLERISFGLLDDIFLLQRLDLFCKLFGLAPDLEGRSSAIAAKRTGTMKLIATKTAADMKRPEARRPFQRSRGVTTDGMRSG
jgi:hypothetical protein